MKKKKKRQTRKIKIVDRTYLSPKGVHVHPPQRKNEGVFIGEKINRKLGIKIKYINYNKKGEPDINEFESLNIQS